MKDDKIVSTDGFTIEDLKAELEARQKMFPRNSEEEGYNRGLQTAIKLIETMLKQSKEQSEK